MTWLRLDDSFAEHPKVVGLTDGAFRCLVELYCYASRNLTDGAIPTAAARRHGSAKQINELVIAGLLHEVAAGYEIHDYLEYNQSRAQAEAERERKSIAGKKGARSRWPDKPPAMAPAIAGAITDGIGTGGANVTVRNVRPTTSVDDADARLPEHLERLNLRGAQRARALTAHQAAPTAVEIIAMDVNGARSPAAAFDSRITKGEHLTNTTSTVKGFDELRAEAHARTKAAS